MIKTFTKHPPHATEDESSGPPNAERHGVRFILRHSMILAILAAVAIFAWYFLF